MKNSKTLSVIYSILIALVVLTASIAAPILCRPFYYAHIDALGLEEYTGLDESLIREAYDNVLDYCTGKTDTFSAGMLPFSDSGASHFSDVRRLFLLDLWTLAGGLIILALMLILARKCRLQPYCFLGRTPGFWGAVGLGSGFALIGVLAALDFNRAFVIFHTLFFPGKDNWIFDWKTDPVILILPQDFFRNCAILILALLLIWCGVLIAYDLVRSKKRPAE